MAYSRNKKQENDKFYTKREAAELALSMVDLSEFDAVIEPSAGNGSFSRLISHERTISLDIAPEAEGIRQQDWLEFDPSEIEGMKALVVGNPPFGNQGSLAMKFIKKSAEIGAECIAFILPKSFKKDSVKNKVPSRYWLEREIDLEDRSFTLNGSDYDVPCVFQIWRLGSEDRKMKEFKKSTDLFEFVKKEQDPDLAFRRVGFYAGRNYAECHDKSEQSHYFIKSKIGVPKLMEVFSSIEWEHNNTAGPKSIGKGELIEKAEEAFANIQIDNTQ